MRKSNKNTLRITVKRHAHLQTLTGAHAKFQKDPAKIEEELHLQEIQFSVCMLFEVESKYYIDQTAKKVKKKKKKKKNTENYKQTPCTSSDLDKITSFKKI